MKIWVQQDFPDKRMYRLAKGLENIGDDLETVLEALVFSYATSAQKDTPEYARGYADGMKNVIGELKKYRRYAKILAEKSKERT